MNDEVDGNGNDGNDGDGNGANVEAAPRRRGRSVFAGPLATGCHSEAPLAGPKNLAVPAVSRRDSSSAVRPPQNDRTAAFGSPFIIEHSLFIIVV